jgi:NAD-reducing hydrogenase small subunit
VTTTDPTPGPATPLGRRPRVATAWLGGCSGCHMSFLDLDEALFDLAARADVVFGPLADVKRFPDEVDLTLVEGAVTNTDNLELARDIRARSRWVVSFGDCAVTGNITALRNGLGDPAEMLQRVYVERSDLPGVLPTEVVPELLPRAEPLHEAIDVDVFLPGCPPSAQRIRLALFALLDALEAGHDLAAVAAARPPDQLRFGN